MNHTPYLFRALLLCLILVGLSPLRGEGEAGRVVIVANPNFEGSVEIARHYAKQRGIPEANIIQLKASTKETITVREYVDTIHNPLLNALLDKGWLEGLKSGGRDAYGRELLSIGIHKMSYLVTVRGVPLRIANDPELLEAGLANVPKQFKINRASVDSELALLCVPQKLTMTAHLPNLLFQQKVPNPQNMMVALRVSRLDGPSTEAVKRLVDRSIEAETNGLKGRAYFDLGGPHAKGDEWLKAAANMAKAAHFDTDIDTKKSAMNHPVRLDAPAIYMGWYKTHALGPWREKRWTVPPGAIAYHLHSYSATTVRSKTKYWLGPLVNQGYCATFGTVYEPYLDLTVWPHLFLQRLLEGASFGEAIAYATPRHSWMNVAIGDPLYRPFKMSQAQQLETIGEGTWDSYAALREIRRLQSEGKQVAAMDYAKKQFMEQPSLALAYELGKIYQQAEMADRALNVLSMVRYIGQFSAEERYLAHQIADLIDQLGSSKDAFTIYQRLLSERDLPRQSRIRFLERGAKVAVSAGEYTLSSRWSLEATKLNTPEPVKK